MKKCVQCRTQIEQMVPYTAYCGGQGINSKLVHIPDDHLKKDSKYFQGINNSGVGVAMNNSVPSVAPNVPAGPSTLSHTNAISQSQNMMNNLTLADDVQKLQQQLQDIKEQVRNL